ncbi:DUF6153 family protein [Nocardia yamanashiensis]|uniref:DUF6153 family protein n=1 Tax=Nocardia yamanashiensis TaxID=209247 RepID=UPI001E41EF10|nr:DUF6153 family protein [Nocardia yamanashiensis]UGT42760.1 DUF6153 family protein [Nocardia yamanashiensis]
MVDQRASIRAAGLVRLLGVLTLLLGIAAMHAGVFATGTMPSHSSVVVSSPADPGAASSEHAAAAPADHRSGGHGIAHECAYFILTALALGIGLILLARIRAAAGARLPARRSQRARPARAPPPAALTLSQLSILRI